MTVSGFGNGFVKNLGVDGFGSGFTTRDVNPPAIVVSNLVLQYDIGNAASYPGSGTTVTDLKGSSNASLVGSPTYSSGYLTFNGTDQYLVTSTSLASKVPTDITSISMWAYPMDNGVLLTERGTASLSSGWFDSQMEMVAGVMKFAMWSPVGYPTPITSTISTPLNAWYNFVIVYDGTKLNAYVNGAAAGTSTFTRLNPIEGGTGIHYVIAGPSATNLGDGGYANMRLGEFLVYSSALSAADVLNNYNASKSKYGL
jgi:hypothetical protein